MNEEDLAEEHWKFLERWMHLVFVDAFIHGYKHAREDEEIVNLMNGKEIKVKRKCKS